MILYHGSNQDIQVIDLTKGHRFKDFGQGFYATPELETARRMALKKASLFGGTPVIIEYEFDEAVLADSALRCKVFPALATVEWLLFVDKNQDRDAAYRHDYDIVKGPIADDGVVLQLTNLRNGLVSPELVAVALQDKYLDQQYFFGTPAALQHLHKVKTITINEQ